MKILYVEDQLTRNIERINRLFDKYLSKNTKKKLRDLENDEYPPGPDKIKTIVEASNLIEIEYHFPEALKKIIEHHENYALFIIDRNLFEEDGYDFEEVQAVDSSFNEEKYETYAEREGDYLLHQLIYKTNVLSRFYYMTAYSAKDEIRGAADIQTHIDMDKFSTDNFIEKGNDEHFEKLKSIIDNVKILNIRNENKDYLHILRNNIGEEACKKFIHVITKKDSANPSDISESLGSLRNIMENILTYLAKNLNAPAICWNKKNQIVSRNVIKWLHYDEISAKDIYKEDLSSIIKNFLYNIQGIGSDFGPHDNLSDIPSGYQATPNTLNALIYALKDIILWFGQICNRYK